MSKIIPINTRLCERYAWRRRHPAQQQQFADWAYRFWLARAFRNSSPQEDWLRAAANCPAGPSPNRRATPPRLRVLPRTSSALFITMLNR